MQDNVSVIIATIVAVVIIVLFPIYNIATRQDSIANNMVVRATTNFVDEVRNKGYIDKETYGEFLNELDKTGNTYDVELEVYKPILLATENDEYESKYEIVYTSGIMADMENSDLFKDEKSVKKSDVYYLYDEYKFYVRVKNTNVTQAQILLDRLLSGKQDERIVVNYGGIVYSNEWEHGENAESMGANISISRPLKSDGITEFKYESIANVFDEISGEMINMYGIACRLTDDISGSNVIKFKLTYKNVESFNLNDGTIITDQLSIEQHIHDSFNIEGFTADITVETLNGNNGKGNYVFLITLSNIDYDFVNNVYLRGMVSIKEGSAYTKYGALSKVNSKEFVIFYEATEIEIEAEGKYYASDHTPIIGTGRADYSRIEVKLNKADENVTDVRYVRGEYTVADFSGSPSFGISIKDTYSDSTGSYMSSNEVGIRITENGKYTVYAKDRHGREKAIVIDIIGLGSDRLKFVINWTPNNDFDMHLTGENNGTEVMHVFYNKKSHNSTEYGHAHLNQDNTQGGSQLYDAEIIILERAAQDMKYTCYIHDYTHRNNTSSHNGFYNKQPVLTIYRGEEGEEEKIYDSTTDKTWTQNGSYAYWYILTYDANTRNVEFIDKYQ